jgi:hypothetical protein
MKKTSYILTAILLVIAHLSGLAQNNRQSTSKGNETNKSMTEESKIDTVNISFGETTILIISNENGNDTINVSDIDTNKDKSAQDYAWAGVDGFQIGAIGLFTSDGKRAFADRPDLELNTTRCSMLGFTPFGKDQRPPTPGCGIRLSVRVICL